MREKEGCEWRKKGNGVIEREGEREGHGAREREGYGGLEKEGGRERKEGKSGWGRGNGEEREREVDVVWRRGVEERGGY